MISEKGLALIRKWEGLRLEAYQDITGCWTIGYGHTLGVCKGDRITQEQAELYLIQDCTKANHAVLNYDYKYHWNQNEEDALTSFAFNLGEASIAQVTDKGTRSKALIAAKMLLYYNAGGRKIDGLVNRRKDEHALFITPDREPDTGTRILALLIEIEERIAEIRTLC